jgi:hypothetical protein
MFVLLASGCGQGLSDQDREHGGQPVEGTVYIAQREDALLDGTIKVTGGWSAALDVVRLVAKRGTAAQIKDQLTQIQQTQAQILAKVDALEQQVRVNAIGDVVTRVADDFKNAQDAETFLGWYLNSGWADYLTTAKTDSLNAAWHLAESDVPGESLGKYGDYWFLFNGNFVFSPLFASNDWMFALAVRLQTLYTADPNAATNAKAELCSYVPRVSRLADLTQQWVDAQYARCYIEVLDESNCGIDVKPPYCQFSGSVYCPVSGGWPFVTWGELVFTGLYKTFIAAETGARNWLTTYHQPLLDQWGVGELRSVAGELKSLATCP